MLSLIISLGEIRSASLEQFLSIAEYEMVVAVNKRAFKKESTFLNPYPSFNGSDYLSSGEYACVQSHKKALQKFLNSAQEVCLILEDDAELNFLPNDLLKILKEQTILMRETNTLLHCGGMQGLKFEPYFWARSRFSNIALHFLEAKFLYRTMAYMVTRKSAESYLQYLSKNPCPVADDWFHFIREVDTQIKFKNLFSHPRDDSNSLIASGRHGNI